MTDTQEPNETHDEQGFQLAPHNVTEDCWWYEEADGIHVVAHGSQFRIPWKQVKAAMKRGGIVTRPS